MPMQDTISKVWLLLPGIAFALGQIGCTPAPATPMQASQDQGRAEYEFVTSEVVRPNKTVLGRLVEVSGFLVARNTVIVRARSPGTLRSLTVYEGQRVCAGDSLGVLDVADLRSRETERRANLESAKAVLAQAQRTFDINRHLADERFISQAALDSLRDQLASAKAQVAASEAALESARLSVSDSQLVAPIDGVVLHRDVVVGEKVATEQALLTIVDPRTVEFAGSVTAKEAMQLSVGMPVELRVDGRAKPMHGTLGRIAAAAQAGSRLIAVTVQLSDSNEILRAGEYADARIQLDDQEPALTLPSSAISSASGQAYAWTIEQNRLRRRAITTGRRDGLRGLIEVTGGLPADVSVLAMRFDNLREGATASVAAMPAKR